MPERRVKFAMITEMKSVRLWEGAGQDLPVGQTLKPLT